jgi:hypothetical protein
MSIHSVIIKRNAKRCCIDVNSFGYVSGEALLEEDRSWQIDRLLEVGVVSYRPMRSTKKTSDAKLKKTKKRARNASTKKK